MSHTKIYRVWRSMVGRCKYPSHTSWKWYGAKGIKVSERWLKFDNFLEDMGDTPFPNASIDRMDTNGDYCHENCRWATPKQQGRNRADNLRLTLNGKTQTAEDWAETLGIDSNLISSRKCKGWSDERTLTTPKIVPYLLTHDGRTMNRHDWAKVTGIKAGTIWYRLNQGWDIDRVLTTPKMKNQFK